MRKKKIEAVPVKVPERFGYKACAQIFEDTLIIDCYKDKTYLARYAITTSGEYASKIGGTWTKKGIQRAFGFENYWEYYTFTETVKFDTEKDKKTAQYFLPHDIKASNTISAITYLESSANEKKRVDARRRKCDRINNIMAEVPELPEDYEAWLDSIAFNRSTYWFYDKEKDEYICTACAKRHKYKSGKHNMKVMCKRKQKECIIKKRQKQVKEETRSGIIQKMPSGRRVIRYFRMKKVSHNTGHVEFDFCEDVRITFNDYTEINKKPEPLKIWYGQYKGADSYNQAFWDTNPANMCMDSCYMYPYIDDALKNTRYEYLGLQEMAHKGWKLDYNRVMRSEWRPFEYITRANMKRMAEDIAGHVCLWDGKIYDYTGVYADGMTLQEIFDIDGQSLNRLKQQDGGLTMLAWLQYQILIGKKIKDEVISWYEQSKITPDMLEDLTKYMSPEKIKNHLSRQKGDPKVILGLWLDYMNMAKKRGYNLKDEIVYKPKDIRLRHDELVDMMNRENIEKTAKEYEDKFKNIKNILPVIKSLYEYENDSYVFVVPNSIADIIVEGSNLHTCVATSDIYLERIDSEETYIGFVRHKESPHISYYTIEFEPNGTVRQKRSEYNRQPNIEDIKKFLKEWQKDIKKRLPKEQEDKQREALRLRLEGMAELMKKSPDYAKKLEADLMAV